MALLVTVGLCVTGAASAAHASPETSLPTPRADAAAMGVAAQDATTAWAWPLTPPWRILRGFEAPKTHYSAGHRGIDMPAQLADTVHSPTSSTVYFAGMVAGRPVLTLQSSDGLLLSFEPVKTTLAKGEPVARGEEVARVASGGHCDQRCVHFGVRREGEYVSPLLFFGGVPRAVLLPLD
jgi:murein DD-endopeptidase MepM/ murein hydrolase activator NlpD